MKSVTSAKTAEEAQQRLTNVLLLILIFVLSLGAVTGVWLISRFDTTPGEVQSAVKTLKEDFDKKLEVAPSDVFKELHDLRHEIHDKELEGKKLALLKKVVESSSDSIVMLNAEGQITHWSVGAEKLFGVTRDNALGYGPAFLMPSDKREKHRESFDQMLKSTGDSANRAIDCDIQTAEGSKRMRVHVWATPQVGAIARFSDVE